jgi:endonuclease/exonuclease/phosphatase family metal-dependent hydrolase
LPSKVIDESRLSETGCMSRPGRRALLLALAVIGGSVLWLGSRTVGTGPAEGNQLQGTPPGAFTSRTFRVGTFNIHTGRGTDGREDLQRTARCLKHLDLVGLNEVDGPRLITGPNQAEQLAETLGAAWLFAPTERSWWCQEFGNALLSRAPLIYWHRIPLDRRGSHTYRNVVVSAVEIDGCRVHVLVTHLDSREPWRRDEQLRAVAELFRSLAPPVILMGDLNARARDPAMRELLDGHDVIDPVAATAGDSGRSRIDWILVRGLVPVAADIEDTGASDHPLVWAELTLPAETTLRR